LVKIDYEKYHKSNSRSQLSGFEIARWDALSHFIPKHILNNKKLDILDYGAGTGLHIELWKKLFPSSNLYLCDISYAGKKKCLQNYPEYQNKYELVTNGHAEFDNGKFDLITSVEVMEHVENLEAYLLDINRLLKPGGVFIWTTPCGNDYSIEHLYSHFTNQIIHTSEGYRKWAWEDPTHIRRLKSKEIDHKLSRIGFSDIHFRFRSHFFSFICTYMPPKMKFQQIRNQLMKLDYLLFRRLQNGASMIGFAKKV